MTKRAASLCRVSTPAQAKQDRYGIPIQLESNKAYADRHGLDIRGTYVDQISGASETRESFYRLLSEAHLYDAVIIYDLYRLARDEELGHRFLRLLQEAGLEVHSSSGNREITNDIQTSLEIALGAEDRRKIAARTYSGLVAKAKSGLIPTHIQLYGYRDIPGTGKVVIDPHEAERVRFIFNLAAEGKSYYEIARAIDDLKDPRTRHGADTWYPAHLTLIVRQTAYKGEYRWPLNSKKGTKPFTIPVPAIVDADTWAKAQKRRVGRPSRTDRPLVGHLRCGWCGMSISSTANPQNGYLYRCNGKFRHSGPRCRLPVKHGKTLERLVETAVRETLSDKERVRSILASIPPADDPNATAREALADRDARWLEAFQAGAISAAELGEYRSEIKAELRALSTPQEERSFPLEEYAKAAKEMPLKELLEFARITAIVTPETIEVVVGNE